MKLILLILIVFLLNLPFGMYRITTEKFSLAWFLAIHLPIPLIYWLRVKSGYGGKAIPLMIILALSGQLTGGKLKKRFNPKINQSE